MKFLLDQDVYEKTAHFLAVQNHDVLRVSQIGLSQASDCKILETAQNLNRILVTRDSDYGALVFVNKIGEGVLYLRMLPSTQESVHIELQRVIQLYAEEDLKKSFIVIEKNGHRKRKIN